MDTNAEMFKVQSQNLITQSIIAQVPSLKKKDRDETLQYIAGSVMGSSPQIYNGPGSAILISG